jgi:hypothetical protein
MAYPPPYPDQPPGTQPQGQPYLPPPVYAPPQFGAPDVPPSQPYAPPPGYAIPPGYPPTALPYGAPPMYGQFPGMPYMVPPLDANNGLATASMILGIIAIVSFWLYGLGVIAGIVGVILGHVALNQIRTVPASNRGMAVAGLIMGYIAIGIAVLCVGGLILLGIALSQNGATTP